MTARQGELVPKPARTTRGQLMRVDDASSEAGLTVTMRCAKCDYQSGRRRFPTVTEAKRGLPCPRCNTM